ncbi:hypothetical protein DVH05_009899 [Phytophthora capsici]|nr:hypothetical protein DVH05_009899 [Phytophthora capsici]
MGLATDNRYFTPDGWKKRPNGTHLVDYFDGADEVWQQVPVDAQITVIYDMPPAKQHATTSFPLSIPLRPPIRQPTLPRFRLPSRL